MIKIKIKNILTVSVLFVLLFQSIFTVSAVENSDLVETNINLEMNNGTNLSASVELTVSRIFLDASDKTYTHQEIENIANDNSKANVMGAISYKIRSDLLSQIKNSFENAKVSPVNELPTYENGKFLDTFDITLTSDFFGLNDSVNSYEFVNGLLDVNANISYTFNFKAENGWNNTYTIILDDYLRYLRTNGKVISKNIEWKILNGNGEQPSKEATIKLKSSNPSSEPKGEKINLFFILDTKNNPSLKTEINIENLDIRDYDILPSFVTNVNYLPSDAVRLFVENKILDWNETIYKNTLKPIIEKTTENIENSEFNQTLDFDFSWDKKTTLDCANPYNLKNMDARPLIMAELIDNDVKLSIVDISSKAFYGLLNTGGVANISKDDLNFGKTLGDIGYPYNVTISFPENISLNGENIHTWNDTISFEGKLISESTPDYKNEDISKNIEINFESSDLNLLGFFTNNPELNFGISAKETNKINVTRVPDEFNIPEKISLSYLNSDAFKLCIQENVFSDSQVDIFLNNKKENFEKHISEIISDLKIDGKIKRDQFNKNIGSNINISNMNNQPPVQTDMFSDTMHSVKFSFSFIPPSFDIPVQKFEFNGMKNQSVSYKIVFPKGIDIAVDDTLNKVVVNENKEKQKYIEISFTPEEHNLTSIASCKITPSVLYLISLFLPCILSFIIVLILIIVIILVRRKRKYRKPSSYFKEKEEGDNERYHEEDYYVPPPPRSK